MTQVTLNVNNSKHEERLFMAFDLSHKTWHIAFTDGTHNRYCTVKDKNLAALDEAIKAAKKKFKLSEDCPVFSCYEAGRDGFWLDRYLRKKGINNLVVDSSSIETSRRHRRVKTDKVDAKKLLSMLVRHYNGERKHWSIVNVPSEEAEDLRRIQREIDRLIKEKGQHSARMRSLLNLDGIVVDTIGGKDWEAQLEQLRDRENKPLRPFKKGELLRENERLELVKKQINALEKEKQRLLEEELDTYPELKKVKQLMLLKGIGKASAWLYILEFFGWRDFKNRKEVGALSGLTPTPFSSGTDNKEQGISKAGNKRIRFMTVEIAWLWVRYQPQSELTQWYKERFAQGSGRMKRIGIVALARKLLISLWRYLETGEPPKGAILSF